jgi:CBS domain-containing protein
MTRPAVTTSPGELVSDAARLMSSHELSRLPVVNGYGRLVGIITRSDVLSVFSRTDDDIRREITQDVIADGFFTDPDRLTVTVKDGIVTLAGAPGGFVLGTNIAYRARHVEGVVAVRDCFTYPSGHSSASTNERILDFPARTAAAVVRHRPGLLRCRQMPRVRSG